MMWTADGDMARRRYGHMVSEHARFCYDDSAMRGIPSVADGLHTVIITRRGLWLRTQTWVRDEKHMART